MVIGIAVALVFVREEARAIDFYEIQIYDTDTVPVGHLTLELHSNSVTTATDEVAKSQMDVYECTRQWRGRLGCCAGSKSGNTFARQCFPRFAINTQDP